MPQKHKARQGWANQRLGYINEYNQGAQGGRRGGGNGRRWGHGKRTAKQGRIT